VLSILATIAKHERVRLSERVKAGLDRARAQGKAVGRPKKAARKNAPHRESKGATILQMIGRAKGATLAASFCGSQPA
jgi:DNA invertase Pin-like site-specific DNA recombinase